MTAPNRRVDLRDESGVSMLIVLGILVVGLLVAVSVVTAAMSAGNLSTRDARMRRAQQAADAGIQAQLYNQSEADLGSTSYNLNGGPLGLTYDLDCTVPVLAGDNVSLSGTLLNVGVSASGLCPESCPAGATVYTCTPTNLNSPIGQNTTYQSVFIPGDKQLFGSDEDELNPRIISLGNESEAYPAGSAAHVYAREEAILAPIAPLQAIEATGSGAGAVTLNGVQLTTKVTLAGSVSTINVNGSAAALNGDIVAHGGVALPAGLIGTNLSASGGSIQSSVTGNPITGAAVSNIKEDTVDAANVPTRGAINVADSKPECGTSAGVSVACSSLITCTVACSTANNAFAITSGKATFAAGDYVFCGFNAAAGTTVTTSGNGVVRIIIRNPSTTQDCSGDKSDTYYGQFYDPVGFNDSLSGLINGLNPSGLQIYNAGSGAVTVGTTNGVSATCTGLTAILTYLGVCLTASVPIQSMIIYAPSSPVSVNTTGCVTNLLGIVNACTAGVFEGVAIGNTTTITATAVTEDLDIGNFPLYSGVNGLQVQQYIQCTPLPVDPNTGVTPTDSTGQPTLTTSAADDENGC